ncbi:Protein kinase domain containing protein [Musa troglodytarum]|uniref:Protein kinase domain containing protein n=1 Tax=Musa troglodytarum TaxID=320322 RepID=A0A9E7HVQ8_9LILI|nr:Protein kinase domain containing protein [Musa troglodytarum]
MIWSCSWHWLSSDPAAAFELSLDFSWLNITFSIFCLFKSNERGKCCRYINAFVAISIADLKATGRLGVPPAFTEVCLSSIPETLTYMALQLMPLLLWFKIRVSYQCQGRTTVLEMMQSPNFSDRCLNSGIIFLHHLIATDDNITLSVCRDAVFVTLANQGGNFSAVDMAACFFGVQGLSFPVSSSESSTPYISKFTSSKFYFCSSSKATSKGHSYQQSSSHLPPYSGSRNWHWGHRPDSSVTSGSDTAYS